ncbi:serine/threonine-protein kinase BSK1-2-like, partial [Dioscorea cayenensis subsp. rotundata]|uniref:Serine/threonine-protein kinase BSK1-2-like n=1 Tax=Dioscorea cayennensis subsp. rotundata TaxID=55577 RepID=A0AB40C3P9_DIOCR
MGCCISAPKQDDDGDHRHDPPRKRRGRRPQQRELRRRRPQTREQRPRRSPDEGTALSQPPAGQTAPSQSPAKGTTPFRHYTLAELMAATHGFADRNMISQGGDEHLPNFAYRGRLQGGQQIAVKRFSNDAWPDEEQFRDEAIRAGRLRHRRLARLIGYCCEGAERLLVAEFMPNNSLARHLFNVKTKTMERSRCLRVAYYIAEALEYCIKEHALYYDLNPHKVLFDEEGNPCLSCFGLVKNLRDERCFHTNIAYTPPGCLYGMASAKSMVFS